MSKSDKAEIMNAWGFMAQFPTDIDARTHIERMRWGDDPFCPHCGSLSVCVIPNERPQPYWCKDCRKHFSVTTGTVFHSANLSPRKCLYVIYLMVVSKKSVSSYQMAREIGCTQKTAWDLAQRIRETWLEKSRLDDPMAGEIKIDDTHIGGRKRNEHGSKVLRNGHGSVGKQPVAGIRDHKSERDQARSVTGTDAVFLQGAVRSEINHATTIYTDYHYADFRMGEYARQIAGLAVGENDGDKARSNGTESFRALLKRVYIGAFHYFSERQAGRHSDAFTSCLGWRDWKAMAHTDQNLRNAVGVLGYKALAAD